MAEEATDHCVTAGSRHNDRPTAVTSTTQQHSPHQQQQQQQQQQWCTVKTTSCQNGLDVAMVWKRAH